MAGKKITLAVDLMGGDIHPSERVKAVKKFVNHLGSGGCSLRIFLTDENTDMIQPIQNSENISLIYCDSKVEMDESPIHALRKKRSSSLSMAIQDMGKGYSDVVITAGNTGAMVALARHWLRPIGDIERPALATLLPALDKRTLLLDVGATVDYRATDLFNLAHIGSWAADALALQSGSSKVALLNVGTESIKGNDAVKQANQLLLESDINYIGYCEGRHLFDGYADVLCCDGFVGNITLKACEAMASMMRSAQKQSMLGRFFNKYSYSLDPADHNGALLLGLDGLVVKSHGNSDTNGFYHALQQAWEHSKGQLINKIKLSMG